MGANDSFDGWDSHTAGQDGFNTVCCTGSNFLLRACHAAEVGWFPTFTSECPRPVGLRVYTAHCAEVGYCIAAETSAALRMSSYRSVGCAELQTAVPCEHIHASCTDYMS